MYWISAGARRQFTATVTAPSLLPVEPRVVLGGVLVEEADAVPGTDAEGGEARRDGVRERVQLAIGPASPSVAAHEGRARLLRGMGAQHLR